MEMHRGQMPGAGAVVRTKYGEGRVCLMAPHPELDNEEFVVTNVIYWLVEEQRKKGITKGEHVRHWTKEEIFGEESVKETEEEKEKTNKEKDEQKKEKKTDKGKEKDKNAK